EKCLRIYDAVDYAENVFDVPVVAYGGSEDPQLQAARNIEARLKMLGLSAKLQVLVAPGLKHSFPPEWRKKAEEAYAPFVTAGGPGSVYLQRQGDRWAAVLPQRLVTEQGRKPQKAQGLQGPIDDAFTDAFLCVRGTGPAWHEATQRYADDNLRRFREEWSKY